MNSSLLTAGGQASPQPHLREFQVLQLLILAWPKRDNLLSIQLG